MNVGNSVRKAIEDWNHGELGSAMLHACNAVDGTAKKLYPTLGSNAGFTRLLRENYGIFGPMGVPGMNLKDTRFPVKVERPKAEGGKSDIADVIYGIHRCNHGHGNALPEGFELIADKGGPAGYTRTQIEKGKIRLSDRVISGLLAVAVLSPANIGQEVPEGYCLTYGKKRVILNINEWWGRASDFPAIVAQENVPIVTLEFGEWME